MAVPWLRVLNAVLGINEIARVVKGRSAAAAAADDPDQLAVSGAEARSRRVWPASSSRR